MINTAKVTVSQVSIRTLGKSNGVPNVNKLVRLFSSSPLPTCFLNNLDFCLNKDLQLRKCVGLLPYMKNFENHYLKWDLMTLDVILNISVNYFKNHLGPLGAN